MWIGNYSEIQSTKFEIVLICVVDLKMGGKNKNKKQRYRIWKKKNGKGEIIFGVNFSNTIDI